MEVPAVGVRSGASYRAASPRGPPSSPGSAKGAKGPNSRPGVGLTKQASREVAETKRLAEQRNNNKISSVLRRPCLLYPLCVVIGALLFSFQVYIFSNPGRQAHLFPFGRNPFAQARTARGLPQNFTTLEESAEEVKDIMEALLADDGAAVSARQAKGLRPSQASPEALALTGAAFPSAPALISRAVNLEEQLLLVLLLRCNLLPLIENALRAGQKIPGSLPLSCVWGPHTVHQEFTPLAGFAVRGYLAYVRCTKPPHYVRPGIIVSLALHLSRLQPGPPLRPHKGESVRAAGEDTLGAPPTAPALQPGAEQQGEPGRAAAEDGLGTPVHTPPGQPGGQQEGERGSASVQGISWHAGAPQSVSTVPGGDGSSEQAHNSTVSGGAHNSTVSGGAHNSTVSEGTRNSTASEGPHNSTVLGPVLDHRRRLLEGSQAQAPSSNSSSVEVEAGRSMSTNRSSVNSGNRTGTQDEAVLKTDTASALESTASTGSTSSTSSTASTGSTSSTASTGSTSSMASTGSTSSTGSTASMGSTGSTGSSSFQGRTAGGAGARVHLFSSDGVFHRPRDLRFVASRLVLETKVQHEGVYIFVDGVKWWYRQTGELTPGNFTCVYGHYWSAPALKGRMGGQLAVLCPHPPPEVKELMLRGQTPSHPPLPTTQLDSPASLNNNPTSHPTNNDNDTDQTNTGIKDSSASAVASSASASAPAAEDASGSLEAETGAAEGGATSAQLEENPNATEGNTAGMEGSTIAAAPDSALEGRLVGGAGRVRGRRRRRRKRFWNRNRSRRKKRGITRRLLLVTSDVSSPSTSTSDSTSVSSRDSTSDSTSDISSDSTSDSTSDSSSGHSRDSSRGSVSGRGLEDWEGQETMRRELSGISDSPGSRGKGSEHGSGSGSQWSRSQQNLQCRHHALVPLMLKDGMGQIASTAYYDPAEPVPVNWREESSFPGCPARGAKTIAEGASKKEFFLCSCTMSMNAAKFLPEWTYYHSFLGVDHFIIYDNNSEDEFEKTALDLSQELPAAYDKWIHENIGSESGNATQSSAGASSSSDLGGNATGGGGEPGAYQRAPGSKTVEVIPWPWLKTQQAGLARCVLDAGPRCEWLTLIDVDEFIAPSFALRMKNRSQVAAAMQAHGPLLHHWIRRAGGCTENVGHISLAPYDFGPSGHRVHPTVGVTAGYDCRIFKSGQNKVVLRPQATTKELWHKVHYWRYNSLMSGLANEKLARFFHYKYQASEEYKSKFRRRVARGVKDWKRSYKGRPRGDGWTIDNGEPVAPKDWPSRFCEKRDRSLAEFVYTVFGEDRGGKLVLPWETPT